MLDFSDGRAQLMNHARRSQSTPTLKHRALVGAEERLWPTPRGGVIFLKNRTTLSAVTGCIGVTLTTTVPLSRRRPNSWSSPTSLCCMYRIRFWHLAACPHGEPLTRASRTQRARGVRDCSRDADAACAGALARCNATKDRRSPNLGQAADGGSCRGAFVRKAATGAQRVASRSHSRSLNLAPLRGRCVQRKRGQLPWHPGFPAEASVCVLSPLRSQSTISFDILSAARTPPSWGPLLSVDGERRRNPALT